MKKGRSNELIEMRNKALVARYYYWSEIWERRYEKVLETLSKQEFYISEITIHRALIRNDTFYRSLLQKRPSIKELAFDYPGFCWVENKKFFSTAHQTTLIF